MAVAGKDLLAQIENSGGIGSKLGIYLRRYILPAIQSRGLPGHVLATPTDKPGDVELQPLTGLVANSNPKNATYVGTNAGGGVIPAPTPVEGINQLTGDVTAGPGSGSQASSVGKVNGAAVPASKTIVGTNSSSQIVDASSATLSNNTNGNAATATYATRAGGAPPTGIATGDLSGNYPSPLVTGLDGLPFINTPAPAVGDVVTWDGVQYTPAPASAGAAQILYTTNTASADIGGYKLWDTVPFGSQFTDPISITNSSGETLIKAFATVAGYPDLTVIPAGEWQADTYIQVSSQVGTTTLYIDVYKRNLAGTETLLFSFASQTISGMGTGINEISTESIQPAISLLVTDRLVIKYSAATSRVPSTDVTLYGGGATNYSHVHTPIGSPAGTSVVIGFVINTGTAGTNVGPMLAAPRAGTFSKCVIVTKASDPSTDLTFKIKQNGVDVFSADPTVAHGTASGTVTTSVALTSVPLAVAAGDVFSMDISSGTASWLFSAQLET